MRITNQMMVQNALRDIQSLTESLAEAQQEAVTGKRVRRTSSDPVDAARIMGLERGLRATEQFRRNSAVARTRLAVEDQVIESARDLLARVSGLATSVSSDDPSDPSRLAALAEVNLALEQLTALGNTQVGDEYIFGGTETRSPPFQADGSYLGNAVERQLQIDEDVRVEVNHAGGQLFGSAIQALLDLGQELQAGTSATIQTAAVGLTSANQDLLGTQADLSARLRHVDSVDGHHAQRARALLETRDGLQNVDTAESLFKVLTAQQAIERAITVLGRVLNTSLADLLR